MSRQQQFVDRVWYGSSPLVWALMPLSAAYGAVAALRRRAYLRNWLRRCRAAVPVVVVGNVTAGGTGKTPVSIWLADQLRERGFVPGIVSRGYGGSRLGSPVRVDSASDPQVVGDEPVLLARRSGCPVIVDADRCRAAAMLIDDGVDVIIADDGLQHYRLERNYEVCVVDGERGFGNGRLLPAGPLREPLARLATVDQVLVNGADEVPATSPSNVLRFDLQPGACERLDGSDRRPPADFAGTTVHAVAGIGNPRRFFRQLRAFGMQVIEHPFPDHAALAASDVAFRDPFPVLMTEKDAVKLGPLRGAFWQVPVNLAIDATASAHWIDALVTRLRTGTGVGIARELPA